MLIKDALIVSLTFGGEYGVLVELYWRDRTKELFKNPVPMPLCKPHISRALAWELRRVHAVRARRLVARYVAHLVERMLSNPCVYYCFFPYFWSQYSEGPATGHLDTGFSWFPCVYKQMLRWFPRFPVATTCFSCSPPDLNLVVTNFMFCLRVK